MKDVYCGGLMEIQPAKLPEFELLAASVPPFNSDSIACKRVDVEDSKSRTVYGRVKQALRKQPINQIINIVQTCLPQCFLIECDNELLYYAAGLTKKAFVSELRAAGYVVKYKVFSNLYAGIPQIGERLYFLGIKNKYAEKGGVFRWPARKKALHIAHYLMNFNSNAVNLRADGYLNEYLHSEPNRGNYKMSRILIENFLVLDTRESELRILQQKVPGLSDGVDGIFYVFEGRLFRMSGREALSLRGFPDGYINKFAEKFTDSMMMEKAAKEVTVPMISSIAANLKEYMDNFIGVDYAGF